MRYSLIFGLLFLCWAMISCGTDSTQETSEEKSKIHKETIFQDQVLRQIYSLQNQRDATGLIVYLKDKNPGYRRFAALALASVQSSVAIEPLSALLTDEDKAVRCAAAYALGQINDKNAEPLLMKAYETESSPEVKKNILEALGKCSTDKGLSFLIELKFDNNQPLLLEGQAWGLYRSGLHNTVSDKGTALAVDLVSGDMVSGDRPEKVRFIAAHYLGRTRGIDLKQYAGQLLGACREEKNIFTRMSLISALGKAQQPEVSQYLKLLLTSDDQVDYRIKVNALRALAGFKYNEIKNLFFNMVKHADVNIAVAASEYFLANGMESDAAGYFEIAQTLYNWRTRANMLSAALKYASTKKDKKRISDWTIAAYKKSVNNYEKAFLLKNLAGDTDNYMFLESRTFENVNKNPVISTYGMDALVEMSRSVKEDKDMLKTFAGIFKKAIESGDSALILFAADVLRDPTMNFKGVFKNTDFLTAALNRCQLPEDLEGWMELRKTIDFFQGTQNASVPMPLKNQPIDWKLVTSISPDQRAVIKTSKGDITIQLMINHAPGSVSNFVKLIKDNFYKTSVVHRAVPNFVIQDGCPRGDGVGGPAFTIGSELGPLYYEEGSVGMASAGKDTEGSQWFITHSPTPHLDGRYTIFAKVVAGMDVVHKIEVGDKVVGFEFL